MLKVIYSHAGSDSDPYVELWYGKEGKIWKFFQIAYLPLDMPCYEPATKGDVQEIISWTGVTIDELTAIIECSETHTVDISGHEPLLCPLYGGCVICHPSQCEGCGMCELFKK